MTGQDDVQRLLQGGRIQEVDPDPETAREEIATARRHIDAALKIVEEDSTLAFTGLYDAMRKAISAHMRTNGYRVTKGAGGHVKTVDAFHEQREVLELRPLDVRRPDNQSAHYSGVGQY